MAKGEIRMNDNTVIIGLVFKNTFWDGAFFGMFIGFIVGWIFEIFRD